MSKRLTEGERHDRALSKAVLHLERSTSGTQTVCGRESAGGLSWVGDEGEFEDRPSMRCKSCERIWQHDRETDMAEARVQTASAEEIS